MERFRIEEKFFNRWAKEGNREDILVSESFEAQTSVENRLALKELGDLRGKKMLDLGCGAGEASVYFALKDAKVTACDVSVECLRLAKSLSLEFKVNIQTVKTRVEALGFPDEGFDLVYGFGVLHHIDINEAVYEIYRVLKNTGMAVFIEPLVYNPLIKIYRYMAKGVRTPTEAPITFKDIRFIGTVFKDVKHREFQFFTLLIFLHFFLVRRWNPSRERYWKKIISESERYEKAFIFLSRMDDTLFKILPCLRRFCWNTVLILRK